MSLEMLKQFESSFNQKFILDTKILAYLDSELPDVVMPVGATLNSFRKAKAIMLIHGLSDFLPCASCGNKTEADVKTKIQSNTRLYATNFGTLRKFCSMACAAKDPETKATRHKSMIDTLGENYRSAILKGKKQSEETKANVKAKRSALWLERTGGKYTHHLQLPEYKHKNQISNFRRKLTKLDSAQFTSVEAVKALVLGVMDLLTEQLGRLPSRAEIKNAVSDEFVGKQCVNRILLELGITTGILQHQASQGQVDIAEFIKLLGLEPMFCDRSTIHPYELDIVVGDLAIEYNGVWCHGEAYGKFKDYHLSKTLECNAKGISLFHVWDHEWSEKPEIIKSMIANKLGKTDRKIHARKCKLVIPSKEQAKLFMETNHVQGSVGWSVAYGLEYNDELVFCMTFGKPRFNKKYKYELLRMATALNTVVVGGMSKVLNEFKSNHGTSLITYSDVRLSGLEPAYRTIFKLVGRNEPGWFGYKDGKVINRLSLTKQKLLDDHPNDYDHSISAIANLEKLGYDRVWDCGQYVYELA